jgi:importin subunit alpha-1
LTGKTPNLTNKSTRTTRSTSSGKSCHGPSQSASSNPATTNTTNTTTSTSITTTDTTNNTTAVNKTENLSQLMTGVMANDTLTQTACTAKIRRLLIGKMNPQEVIDMNIVPYFVEFLLRDDTPALQFEAAWVIACITCGTTEQTKVVVDHGAVPILVKLLSSKYDSVRGEAVWALLNIAGDSPAFRDLVLEAEVMNPLLKILQTSENQLSMIRDGVWLLMNLCNGKPQPNFERVRIAFPVLMELLSHNDEQVYGHSCWALSHLTDSPKNKFEDLIDDGVCLRLIELLEKSSHHMQKHASNSLLKNLKKMKY